MHSTDTTDIVYLLQTLLSDKGSISIYVKPYMPTQIPEEDKVAICSFDVWPDHRTDHALTSDLAIQAIRRNKPV